MSYKEKYEEAFERAKGMYEQGMMPERIEYIFPEIKESEDERIRKTLIVYLKGRLHSGFNREVKICNDGIAWLKKQRELIKEYEDKLDKCTCESFDKGYKAALENQGKARHTCRNCQTFQDLHQNCPYSPIYQCTDLTEAHKHLDDETHCEFWLEKQGEQNLTDKVEPKFKVGDCIRHKGSDECYRIVTIDDNYYFCENNHAWAIKSQDYFELVEQKPTDKVKPRFKVGDWILIDNPCKIISIDNHGNYLVRYWDCEAIDKLHTLSKKFCESYFHLWTIQDAKDGDVLVYKGEIFLLKSYTLWHKIVYHCCYDEKELHNHSIYESLKKEDFENIHPATKEQRDLLFQKMKEAGYEWDAEKKELKKIEQNHVEWHREDEQNLNVCLGYIPDEFLRSWLKDAIHAKYGKHAWGEEDERICACLINAQEKELESEIISDLKEMYGERIDWLKSLKERMEGE